LKRSMGKLPFLKKKSKKAGNRFLPFSKQYKNRHPESLKRSIGCRFLLFL
jgi:hypothetical protein